MITDNPTLLLPGQGFSSPICGRGSSSSHSTDTKAEQLLRSASCNLLGGEIIALLDNEDARVRANGVFLAEVLLADIEAQRIIEEAKQREITRKAEAGRMTEVWENHATELAKHACLPLFVTLCLLFEFASDEKQDDVMAVIQAYEDGFDNPMDVHYWNRWATKQMPYLERREVLITARRKAKACRTKGTPNTTPGVNWDKQSGIPKADPKYVASRIAGGLPQRGVIQPIKRDGNGGKKR